MITWQYWLLIFAAVLVLLARIIAAVNRRAERKQRDFTRKLETLLQPRETVKIICPQKKGRWILTGSRLIFEKRGRFTAITLKSITKVQGINASGNRTTVPEKMVRMTVKAEEEYTLVHSCPEFCQLAAQLSQQVKKQNEKKKAAKAAKSPKG